jgi:hypothetical protein
MGNSKSSAHENQDVDTKNRLHSKKKRGNNPTESSIKDSSNNKENKYKSNKSDPKMESKKKVDKSEQVLISADTNAVDGLKVLQVSNDSLASLNNIAKPMENGSYHESSITVQEKQKSESDLIQNHSSNNNNNNIDSEYTNINECSSSPNNNQSNFVEESVSNTQPRKIDDIEPVYEDTLDMDLLENNQATSQSENKNYAKNHDNHLQNQSPPTGGDLELNVDSNTEIYSHVNLSNINSKKLPTNEIKKNTALGGIFNKLSNRNAKQNASNQGSNVNTASSSSINNNHQSAELPSKSFDPDQEYLEQKKNLDVIETRNVSVKRNDTHHESYDLNK